VVAVSLVPGAMFAIQSFIVQLPQGGAGGAPRVRP